MNNSHEMCSSADNVSGFVSPNGSLMNVNSDLSMRNKNKRDRLVNFKKSHISHSTGDLNLNRINLSLFGDVQLNDSQFFEVMYVGKIRVSHKKLPKTFIDDAIPKFIAHDKMKMKNLEISEKSIQDFEHQSFSDTSVIQNEIKTILTKDKDDQSGSDTSSVHSIELKNKDFDETKSRNEPEIEKPKQIFFQRSQSMKAEDFPKRYRSASIGSIEQNRTMVYLLGRTDLRLISPDRKQVLLHKKFEDVVNVVQGTENIEHFGIICNELKDNKQEYIGYVFKCQSGSIAHDIVNSMIKSLEVLEQDKQEKLNEEEGKSQVLLTCEHCPMIWFNKLCSTIEGLSEKKVYNVIIKHIEELSTEDYEILMEKFFASDKVNEYSIHERNKFLIALIEAHCQLRQQRHVHDTIENRSEFLNHYLGGSTILMKAKRSLTSSFDQFLKRRGSKDFPDNNNNQISHEDDLKKFKTGRSASLSPNASQTFTFKNGTDEKKQVNTSKMEMFLKVGNTTKEKNSQNGSWRHNILKNVTVSGTDNHISKNHVDESINLLPKKTKEKYVTKKKRSNQELRELWKFAGKQIIMLIRMEKENIRLLEQQNEHEIRRLKLNYDEIIICDQRLVEVWEKFIYQAAKNEIDNRLFLQTIKSGVPRIVRGEVWKMLAMQYNKSHQVPDHSEFSNFNVPYNEILKNLTEQQHAIFMDIGRTFPNHEYYKAPFGMGQLSLFNILKAYSILDPELGYCQGLAFICGVLLLHLSEDDAFDLLKHLMFDRQLRLNYLPDMKHFQLQLYQMSRLIKDNLPDIHELFETNDVATTLFASSWMLTLFSSSFELGFVTRVYDLLLYASYEVVFRVIIALLEVHKDELLKLDNFEDIMDYLKNVIPKVNEAQLLHILKRVYELNIARQLLDYKIEYNVLKDEIQNTTKHVESLKMAREDIKNLQKQVQMAESNVERLEGIRHSQQQEIQSMQSQVHSLEVTIETLGDYLTSLTTSRTDIDVPADIRRLLQLFEYQQNKFQQQQAKRRPVFLDRKIGKSVSVNNNLGMSLKVLIEQNENDNQTPPCAVTPTPDCSQSYFSSPSISKNKSSDSLTESLQHNATKQYMKLSYRESPEKPKLVEQAAIRESVREDNEEECLVSEQEHPLTCDDVSFQFNTMQLKSIKTINAFKKQT
ncbi:TBC1 domain family member 4 isoform X3 [Chironomus tepperi]